VQQPLLFTSDAADNTDADHLSIKIITYSVVWYQIEQGSPPGAEGKLHIKNNKETKGRTPRLIFP